MPIIFPRTFFTSPHSYTIQLNFVFISAPKLINTWPDMRGEPCICDTRLLGKGTCSSAIGCKPPVPGTCPSWCGTEGLCCKQNEAINECDGTHVRPHISFKETYPLWNDLASIPNVDPPETTRTYRCILPPGKLSAYPENAHLCKYY